MLSVLMPATAVRRLSAAGKRDAIVSIYIAGRRSPSSIVLHTQSSSKPSLHHPPCVTPFGTRLLRWSFWACLGGALGCVRAEGAGCLNTGAAGNASSLFERDPFQGQREGPSRASMDLATGISPSRAGSAGVSSSADGRPQSQMGLLPGAGEKRPLSRGAEGPASAHSVPAMHSGHGVAANQGLHPSSKWDVCTSHPRGLMNNRTPHTCKGSLCKVGRGSWIAVFCLRHY